MPQRRRKMNKIKILLTLFLGLVGLMALYGCAQDRYALGVPVAPAGVKPPVIMAYFASTQITYGYPWRVYLAAEDPEGSMLRIAIQVSHVGYGNYPTDWIYLKPPHQKNFVGYMQWNTQSIHTGYLPEWTQTYLRITVADKYDVQSNEIELPLLFVSGAELSPPPPAPFNQGNVPFLGYIDVNLYNPYQDKDDFFIND